MKRVLLIAVVGVVLLAGPLAEAIEVHLKVEPGTDNYYDLYTDGSTTPTTQPAEAIQFGDPPFSDLASMEPLEIPADWNELEIINAISIGIKKIANHELPEHKLALLDDLKRIKLQWRTLPYDVVRPTNKVGDKFRISRETGPAGDGLILEVWVSDGIQQRVRPQILDNAGLWKTYLGKIHLSSSNKFLMFNLNYGSRTDRHLLQLMSDPHLWIALSTKRLPDGSRVVVSSTPVQYYSSEVRHMGGGVQPAIIQPAGKIQLEGTVSTSDKFYNLNIDPRDGTQTLTLQPVVTASTSDNFYEAYIDGGATTQPAVSVKKIIASLAIDNGDSSHYWTLSRVTTTTDERVSSVPVWQNVETGYFEGLLSQEQWGDNFECPYCNKPFDPDEKTEPATDTGDKIKNKIHWAVGSAAKYTCEDCKKEVTRVVIPNGLPRGKLLNDKCPSVSGHFVTLPDGSIGIYLYVEPISPEAEAKSQK